MSSLSLQRSWVAGKEPALPGFIAAELAGAICSLPADDWRGLRRRYVPARGEVRNLALCAKQGGNL